MRHSGWRSPTRPDHSFHVRVRSVIQRVAQVFSIDAEQVLKPGRYPVTVRARSVLSFWAPREFGLTTVDLAQRLGLSQSTVSQSVQRGEKLVTQRGLNLFNET